MSNPGTPDWQRGIAHPQVVAGSANGAATFMDVTLPPNCESLMVMCDNGGILQVSSVIGTTSFAKYPFVPYAGVAALGASTWLISTAQPQDAVVQINLAVAPGLNWVAVADQGVRMVADAVLSSIIAPNGGNPDKVGLLMMLMDLLGTAHVAESDTHGRIALGDPNVPDGVMPQVASITQWGTFPNGGVVVPAPAAGTAWYIESVDVVATNPDGLTLVDTSGNRKLQIGMSTVAGGTAYGTTGYLGKMRATTSLAYNAFSVNQNATFSIRLAPGP